MRVLLSVLMLLGVAAPAVAQVPPPSAEFSEAYDAAIAASPTARQLEAEQREWVHYRDLDEYGYGADGDDERMLDLRRRAARDRALGQIEMGSPDAMGSCVGEALKGCSSRAAGWVTSPDGARLFWQLQDGFTDETGITGGVMLLSAGGMGAVRPVAWAFEGYRYEAPTLLMIDGKMYVAASGRMQGTGNGNADVIFRWEPDAAQPLTQVDNWSWRDTLSERLPTGLEVWKGVDYRYNDEGVWAWTPLWREGDGNCCASGGSAMLMFRIEDDRLVLDGVSAHDTIVEVAVSEPIEVLDFVGRWSMCAHWGGEEPYDADRRAEIEAAVTELRCEALIAEAAHLETKYAENPATLALIRRMKTE
ncbi:MAG: hypothetical protein V4707_10225 [Pseudomonadota bacterium]